MKISKEQKRLRTLENRQLLTLVEKVVCVCLCAQDVSRIQLDPANDQILTIITYVGCGLSSLFLGITVLTYTIFE